MRLEIGLALFLLAGALGGAQTVHREATSPPDLSGTWKLNRNKSELRVWGEIAPETVVIVQSERQIELKRQINGSWFLARYPLDGHEQTVSTFDHHERVGRAHWSKRSLIIEERTVGHFGGVPDFEDVEKTATRWTLSSDGKVLTERHQERATTSVFERQQ